MNKEEEGRLRKLLEKNHTWELTEYTSEGLRPPIRVTIGTSALGRFLLKKHHGVNPRCSYILTPFNPTINNQLKNLEKMDTHIHPAILKFIKDPRNEQIKESNIELAETDMEGLN